MKLYALVPACAIHCLVLAACDMPNPDGMAIAEAKGVSEIYEVEQFARLFPDAYHFISHYSGTKGSPSWNSKAGLHGRYLVSLSFPIEFDATRTHPRRTGPAAFHLIEVSEVRMKPDGTVAGFSYASTQVRFGIEDWQRVVKSGGDWSVLGIEVIKDQPLENFDKAWPTG